MPLSPPNTTTVSKYPPKRGQETIATDSDTFSSAEAYYEEGRFYKINGKDVAADENVPVTVMTRHPLAGFTRPMT